MNPKRPGFIYEWQTDAEQNLPRARAELLDVFVRPDADWSFVTRDQGWDDRFTAAVDAFVFSRSKIEGREPRFAAQELFPVYKRLLEAAAAKAPTKLWFSVVLPNYGYDFSTKSIRFTERSAAGEGHTLLELPENSRFYEFTLPQSARATANYVITMESVQPPSTPGMSTGIESPTHSWRGAGGVNTQVELIALDRQLQLTSIPLDPSTAERLAKGDSYFSMGRMTGLTARVYVDADRVQLSERTMEGRQPTPYGILFAKVQRIDIHGPKPKEELLASFAPGTLPAPSAARPVETTVIPKPAAPPAGDSLKDRQARQAQMDKEGADLRNSVVEELRRKAMAAQAAAGAEQAAAMAQASSPGCGDSSPSKPSQDVVNVEFVNVSKQPRKLHWVNFGGMRQAYGVVQPGQRLALQTYVAHRWVVTDLADACLAALVISKDSSRVEVR